MSSETNARGGSDNRGEVRAVPDRCPGALTAHQAADGALARVRLPGGRLTSEQLLVLARAATDLSTGSMELSSRGNIQFRSVTDTDELARRLADADLLPSPTHERVRNILASPLSGRVGGLTDVRQLIADLDLALISHPELAALPGRTLFALDDGRGDVIAPGPDFAVQAVDDTTYALILAGNDSGARIDRSRVVDVLVDAARSFVEFRTTEWRLRELDEGPARVLASLGLRRGTPTSLPVASENIPPVGWLTQSDGRVTLGGVLALGTLDARLAEFLAAVDKPIVVTPWRSLIVCDLDEDVADTVVRVLAPLGLIFDENSPWIEASACTGSPGCEKSHSDVRADLTDAVDTLQITPGQRQHWSGCERRCGRPAGDVLDVVAGPTGYRVS
ncbi:precorrin-3B synthase [Rhodococcus sp. G-MC3]|uniref:precorrin-3B synthase n=1 Tax=Rhodococcus sp. G-MC3 TaxID=3046209 RepID=UPI0024BB8330|nr:precorrin-3B synthase [Rhodococcus sp. G-MC3]MDJ0394999.1 precorrin-3B synthase [Rhodococcus sp. G-MC3]